MTRDLAQLFGIEKARNAVPLHDRITWTPEDQRRFLAAIPIMAREQGVLLVPDGNTVRADDVGEIAVRQLPDGRWAVIMATTHGTAGQLTYQDAREAAETAAAWITCWAEVARQQRRKGARP